MSADQTKSERGAMPRKPLKIRYARKEIKVSKIYAKDFDPATPVIELCKYSNAVERIKELEQGIDTGNISDGYHTFNELYEFRKLYNAALFNEWAAIGKYDVHESTRHHDGEEYFGGGWFIVVALLSGGQISNHYKMADWNLFRIPEREKTTYPYDGHTGEDVLVRLRSI